MQQDNRQKTGHADLEPGSSLRAAREAAGLSAKQVADQLNLLITHVEALENNDFSCFNANLFARGYVRSYARLLELEDSGLLHATNQRLADMNSGSRPDSKKAVGAAAKPHVRVILALLLAVAVWTVAVLVTQHNVGAIDAKVELLPGLVDPLPFEVITPLGAELLQRANGEFLDEDEGVETEIHVAKLVLDFSEDCWVQITNPHGDILVRGLQQGGQHLELSAQAPMDIVLAYWPAVTVYFNGQRVELNKYTSGNAARLRITES